MADNEQKGEESIELRVYFTGLIAITEEKGGAQALLVDARTPGRVKGTESAIPHYPVLQFSWSNLCGTEQDKKDLEGVFFKVDAPGRRRSQAPGCKERGLWLLDKDVVFLDPSLSASPSHFRVVNTPARGEIPQNGDSRSVDWLAVLHGEGMTPGVLRDGLLNPASKEAKKRVAAYFQMRQGTLGTAGFASERGQFVVFDTPRRQETRAIASVALFSARVRGGEVRFRSRKFDGSEGIELSLKPSSREKPVEVWVLNQEWDTIENLVPSRAIEFGRVNSEYLNLYDLLANRPELDDLPRPVRTVRPGAVRPDVDGTEDADLARIFFPTSSAEGAVTAPCSPTFIR